MTETPSAPASWTPYHFGLIVTGEGERQHITLLFKALEASGCCTFDVIRRIGQRKPKKTPVCTKLKIVNKTISNRDEDEISIPARCFLKKETDAGKRCFVVLIDDLEHDNRGIAREVFQRYRTALDTLLTPVNMNHLASVHFFVNMIEAYYFANAQAINGVMSPGTPLQDHAGDVEEIRHPKNDLKNMGLGFDEVSHGREILANLDVSHVLANPEHCKALRTMFHWCIEKMKSHPRYAYWITTSQLPQKVTAQHWPVTTGQ
jgi:hypothetical protein